jgi:hypothetical protein
MEAKAAEGNSSGSLERRTLYCCHSCVRAVKQLTRCDRCHAVIYCGETCQRLDWPEHRLSCKISEQNQEMGREFTVIPLPSLEREEEKTQSERSIQALSLNAVAPTRNCASYTFVSRGLLVLNSVNLSDTMGVACELGELTYAHNQFVIEASVMIGRWFFCVEVCAALDSERRWVGGFLGHAHYFFACLIPLPEETDWEEILFEWVVKNALSLPNKPDTLNLSVLFLPDEEEGTIYEWKQRQ